MHVKSTCAGNRLLFFYGSLFGECGKCGMVSCNQSTASSSCCSRLNSYRRADQADQVTSPHGRRQMLPQRVAKPSNHARLTCLRRWRAPSAPFILLRLHRSVLLSLTGCVARSQTAGSTPARWDWFLPLGFFTLTCCFAIIAAGNLLNPTQVHAGPSPDGSSHPHVTITEPELQPGQWPIKCCADIEAFMFVGEG